jgi:hypothetical protein
VSPATIAGVCPLRELTGTCAHPQLETVERIARACGTTVGWLLGEYGYSLSVEQRRKLRDAAAAIIDATASPSRAVPRCPTVTTRDSN